MLLSSVFDITSILPGQAQRHDIQASSASPSSNTSDSLSSEPNHAIKNAAAVTIQYTEKEKRERKYECQYCKKRFSRPSSLTSHVYTHTGERPFACDFLGCTKRFSVLSNLRRHYKVHASRRTYGGSRLHSVSNFHGSIYAGAGTAPDRRDAFGGGVASPAGLAFSRPAQASIPPFLARQEHPAMRSAYNMLAPVGRELYSSSIALQHGPDMAAMSTELSNYSSGSYAPSFRTTASTLSLPQSFSAPLLAGLAGEHSLSSASECQAPLSASTNSSSSNSSSPTSKQPLCLADLRPGISSSAHGTVRVGGGGFASTNQLNSAITASQFEAIFGRLPTEHQFGNNDAGGASGCGSDSDNSSDINLLPLGERDSGSLDALDMLMTSESLASSSDNTHYAHTALTGFFPRSPRIATQAILTNTSVTTKAMNGAIESAGSTSQDLSLLFSPAEIKSAPSALVGLPPLLNRLPLRQANAPAYALEGTKMLGSIGGMATSLDLAAQEAGDCGAKNTMWHLLQD
ncbi:hypothetical protein GGI00_001748 [Coemansia sp. RSA 2681]|nr:hypothetical protein GGI00_001748 [Coemansia sp. RSA 2681]